MDDNSTESSTPDISVSVLGIGQRGYQTVQKLDTEAPIKTISVTDTGDTQTVSDSVAGDTFCILTADLDEPDIVDQFGSILRSVEPFTIVLLEGSAPYGKLIAEHADFLLPIHIQDDHREWLVQTILDLCESVLPSTGCEIGWGDLVYAFKNQVGYVSIIPLIETSNRWTVELFPKREISDLDSLLYFFCTPEHPDQQAVESAISLLDPPATRAFLFDYRVNPRYSETPHVKQILTSEVDTETRMRLLEH